MRAKSKETVDTGDLIGARVGLANELLIDPRGRSFHEMIVYAERSFSDRLYEPHDGEELDRNQEHWTKELMLSTKNALEENFSRKRLNYYYQMVQVVLKDKAEALRQEEASKASFSQQSSYSRDRNNKEGWWERAKRKISDKIDKLDKKARDEKQI